MKTHSPRLTSVGSPHNGGVRWTVFESMDTAVGVPAQTFKLWTQATLPIVAEVGAFVVYRTPRGSDKSFPNAPKG